MDEEVLNQMPPWLREEFIKQQQEEIARRFARWEREQKIVDEPFIVED